MRWRQLASFEAALRRTARRYSLCADDAEDAYQRAVEILLTKSPPGRSSAPRRLDAGGDPPRGARGAALARAAARPGRPTTTANRSTGSPATGPDPQERLERREQLADAVRLLLELKPQERRALVLQAHGYSYAEIRQLCGWTYTKVNRCLAEGRARLRQLGAIA